MTKKILLLNTLPEINYWKKNQNQRFVGMPLGLLSLGTALEKAGYSVKVIDPVTRQNYLEEIEKAVREGILWVGITTMTNGVSSALEMSRFIKEINSEVPICWGGVHPTLFIESVLKEPSVDYAAWGEGERLVVELSEVINGSRPANGVQGISYRKPDGSVGFTPRSYYLDINEFGMPHYDILDIEAYIHMNFRQLLPSAKKELGKLIAINSAIGCPYHCTFCWNNHPAQKFRIKRLEVLMENIDYVVKRFDPDVIHLQDDLFFADKKRFLAFLDEYDNRGYRFQWFTNCRANYVADSYLGDEVLGRINDKCIWLGMGIESGSEEIRKRLRKQLGDKQIYKAADLLGRNNIFGAYSFMTGLPYEKLHDTIKTIKMIFEIKRLNPKSCFALNTFRPYPGSPLFEEAVRSGFVPPSDLEGWAVLQDDTISGLRRDIIPWLDVNQAKYFENVANAVNANYSIIQKESFIKFLYNYASDHYYLFSFKARLFLNYWGGLFEVRLENAFRNFTRKAYNAVFSGMLSFGRHPAK